MDNTAIYQDIAKMATHVYVHPEVLARTWTSAECADYQLPLSIILGFLSHAIPPLCEKHIRIKDSSIGQAVVDIVRNSSLSSLLEYEPAERCVRYREDISLSIKTDIAKFVNEHVQGIGN